MYGKLFAQMYDGTLGTKGPWQALVTFQQLIILADKEGIVDMTAEAIARRTTIPLSVIQDGLGPLEAVDPQSRTPDEDGRRIVRLSDERAWGWRIVNHDKYRKIRSQEERREYMRQYQRERRAKERGVNKSVNKSTESKRGQPSAVGSNQYGSNQYAGTASARKVRAIQDKAIEQEGFSEAWARYPRRAGGNSRALAHKAFAARVAGGVPVAEMVAGVERYAAFIRATGKEGTEYVKQGASFFGPGEHWREPWDAPVGRGEARANGNRAVLDRFLGVASGE